MSPKQSPDRLDMHKVARPMSGKNGSDFLLKN